MKNILFLLFSLSLLSTAVRADDSITILNVSPKQTEALKVGSEVEIKYEVEYTLESSDLGQITLVIQGASNEPIANENYIATKGTHIETLEATITVPDTRLIHVFTPLSIQGQSRTSIVQSRLHRVIK